MSAKLRMVTFLTVFVTLSVLSASKVSAAELKQSRFDNELQKIRYEMVNRANFAEQYYAAGDDDVALSDLAQAEAPPPDYKSPVRAFLYSLAVPGLGQYYYGSRIKPLLFVAVEVVGWMQALKYHGEGNDITDEFQAFNDEHWSKVVYYEYLREGYDGTTRPDTVENDDWPWDEYTKGFTHVLPDDENQQYYEMTGKYNQFAWGWDDAKGKENDYNWEQYRAAYPGFEVRILDSMTTPNSSNRVLYENMRDDANQKYSKSMKFVFVLMANHLISSL
ncbi:MAG: hypothetical protein U9R56_00285, partial [candidate division Zixibacteria bacterium]|nr:hypothetical protein [candidate division Zixibacteria bacterium]